MHNEFLIGLDKSNSLEYPDYLPEEIDVLLNMAQEAIIKQRFTGNNFKRESVEETEKRIQDLRELVVNYTLLVPFAATADNKPNGRFVDLPDDFWFMLNEEVTINITDCNNNVLQKRIGVRSMSHDRYNVTVRCPFTAPSDEVAFKLPYTNNQVEIIIGGNNVGTSSDITYHLRYIKAPVEMNYYTPQDCELAPHMHREIVAYAVTLALENIESQRYGTQNNEILRNE